LEILGFNAGAADPIGARPYPVTRAGFAQIFFAASGSGWVAGNDGAQIQVRDLTPRGR
jgi:hypothetical protein